MFFIISLLAPYLPFSLCSPDHIAPRHATGDSPKLVACLDLFRVQGRWAAASRLAWVRSMLTSANDVAGGQGLSKQAPNTFPAAAYWSLWGSFFEEVFYEHKNNIIQVDPTHLLCWSMWLSNQP